MSTNFGRLFLSLFLTLGVAASSTILSANGQVALTTTSGNYKSFSDSLPNQTLRNGNDSLPVNGIDSLHSNDSALQTLRDSIIKIDTLTALKTDSLHRNDTVNVADQGEIQDIITYKALDSIVYDMGSKKMFLYDTVDLKYQKIALKANLVDFDWNTFTLRARGSTDTSGKTIGKPVFTDNNSDYKADSLGYNFKTKKGLVYHVITKEGDAYLHLDAGKKTEYEEWYGRKTEYTTCDLDDPHFYFKAKKVKIVPDKIMVTGPANLWIADIPTPLYLPFGLFPIKQGQRSGIIVPEYGQDAILGFFLRNGGYYWAVNDYLGLKFTEEIATNGTFGFGVASQYALRYRFTGSFNFSFLRSRPEDPDLPGAKATNAYSLSWSHTEDPRSLPNSTFGASVQMQSSDFYAASRITDTRLLNTSFNSTVSFSHTFVGSPFSLMINMRHSQNLLNRTIDFTIPTVRLSMSRYTPFKNKIQSDKPKWYESIGISYSLEFQNQLSTYDSILFQSQSLNKFSFGVNQQLTIDAPFKVLKYFTLTPAVSYQERTYFKSTSERWNPDTVYSIEAGGRIDSLDGRVISDTSWHFNSARNFAASLTFGTKVTGIFKFKGKWLKAIKHVFTPSIAANYNPDFGTNFWGYYKTVQIDARGDLGRYQVFDPGAIYGVPQPGRTGSLTWTLGNNFEMKTYSKTDSVNHEKKMGLLDQVNLSGGYNFAADSLRLLPFNLSIVSARLFNLINLQFNSVFSPYATDSLNNPINTFEWTKYRKLLRFTQANVSASFSLHSKQKPAPKAADDAPKYIADYVSYSPDQIYNFDIPWNFSFNYNFNVTRGTYLNPDTILTIQTVNAKLDFNLTKHWKVALSTGFDISRRQITLTNVTVVRDLHCWELTFNWTPSLPTFPAQQFSIILQPKSPTLKDLKVQKKNSLQQF